MNKIQFLGLFLFKVIARYLNYLLPIAFCLILLLFVYLKFKPVFQFKPSVSEGIIGLYTPNNLPPIVTNLLSDSLVSFDKSGNIVPNLSNQWQSNANATSYTFKLKDNLFWTDTGQVISSQLKFNLPDVEVSYPDEKTLVFKLPDSFSALPSLLTTPVFKEDSLIGTGKYKLSYQELNRGFVIKLILSPLKDNLPTVVIRFYPDEKSAKVAFDLGEISVLMGLSDIEQFDNMPNINIKKIVNFNKIVGIFYNSKDPALSDKNYRKALTASSPKIEGEVRAKTSIPPFSWAYNDLVKDYLGDSEALKTYLNKVSLGKDNIILLTATPSLSQLGEKVVNSWKLAGINAALRVESGIPQNFQALLITESIQSDPDQYTLWHSTQTNTNLSKYKSDRVDKDLEDGRKIIDFKTRQDKYFDFQKVLADDSPATFLYFPSTNILYRRRVGEDLNKILFIQIPQNQ